MKKSDFSAFPLSISARRSASHSVSESPIILCVLDVGGMMVPSSRLMRVSMFPLVILFVNRRSNLDNGYFAMAAQTKPLLHTWSLAVEWQFYIWMPIFASTVWHRWERMKSSCSLD